MSATNEEMSTYSKERLSPEIAAELERLGCEVDSLDDIPDPKFVTFGDQRVAVPEAYRQFVNDIRWPEAEVQGRASNGWGYTGIYFFDDLRPFHAAELGYDYAGVDSDRYLYIGGKDGGNYLLLLRLDDPNPASPKLYQVDHDPHEERPVSYNSVLDVVSCLDVLDESQLQRLIDKLDSKGNEKLIDTLHAIEKIGPAAAPALDRLIELLRDKRNLARWIMRTLSAIDVASPAVIDGAVELIADRDYTSHNADSAKRMAAELLASFGSLAESTVPKLNEVLEVKGGDNWKPAVIDAIEAICGEFDEFPPVWFDLLSDPDTHDKLQAECAAAMTRMMRPEQREQVYQALMAVLRSDRHLIYPQTTVAALLTGGTVADLLTGGGDESEDPTQPFAEHRNEIVSVLESFFDREDGRLRLDKRGRSRHVAAVAALARLDALPIDKALPVVEQALASSDYYRHARIAVAFPSLGEAVVPLVPAIVDTLDDWRAEDEIVPHVIELCKEVPQIIDTVAQVTCDEENLKKRKLRCHILKVLEALGSEALSALPVVTQCLDAEYRSVRGAARRAARAIIADVPEMWMETLDDPQAHDVLRAECAQAVISASKDDEEERVYESLMAVLTSEDESAALQTELAPHLVCEEETPIVEPFGEYGVIYEATPRFEGRRDEIIAVLEQLRERDDFELQRQVVILQAGLGVLSAESALPVVKQLFHNTHRRLNGEATHLAAFLGEEARPLIPNLIENLGASVGHKSAAALVVLYDDLPEILEAVAGAARGDVDYDEKAARGVKRQVAALGVLGELGPDAQEAKSVVEACLSDSSPKVREAAKEVIATI